MSKITGFSVIKNLFFINIFFFFVVASGLFITFLVSDIETNQSSSLSKSVLGVDNEIVNVSTQVRAEIIEFIVRPEYRIPKTNNWDTIVTSFEILPCSGSAVLYNYSDISTSVSGKGVIQIKPTDFIEDGSYRFKIKGYSHLTKEFGCYPITNINTYLDLYLEGTLLAGDTSVIPDNYINSLDITNTISKLYISDYKNDLNQDSRVNSLDLSNIVNNLFIHGD